MDNSLDDKYGVVDNQVNISIIIFLLITTTVGLVDKFFLLTKLWIIQRRQGRVEGTRAELVKYPNTATLIFANFGNYFGAKEKLEGLLI